MLICTGSAWGIGISPPKGGLQTVDKFRGQVPRNFFAIEPEKSALTRL